MPLIISTWSFASRGNESAWEILLRGGEALDAVERCCAVVDAAPDVDSVGFGGLPDASGRVSLDGCVMLSPSRCGSACVLKRHLHPVSVARLVMERTTHVMLAGDDADLFADAHGVAAAELLAPEARARWEDWTRSRQIPDQSRDILAPRRCDTPSNSEARWKHHDTIGTLCLDARGTLAGACSTSGTPFKVPGRVGDSPIIGHGLYVDPEAGAATATGTGELIMGVCGSFLAVEFMRQGMSPLEALRLTLERIRGSYVLEPHHQVAMLAMRPDGLWASAALRPGFRAAIRDDNGARILEPDATILPDIA
ncbi:MAG: isoaspartyl peptidase/L-asparaginase [Phycisphaerae bacterium]|nr:isoaspartyl peptidase/L-asparaginase [Phycisphaerae bacterium]